MRYFVDTEFAEDGRRLELISIGVVSEDGREYYAEHDGFDESLCNPWVRKNVLPKLGPVSEREPREAIAWELSKFVTMEEPPEFWTYFGSYDWVALCWIFGRMVDLPGHFPMFCHDLQQWWWQLGRPRIKPADPDNEHNALADAHWNKLLHERLSLYRDARRTEIAEKIVRDLRGRQGFDHCWDGTDRGIQREIRDDWTNIIKLLL